MKKPYLLVLVLIALIQTIFTSCKKLENAEPKTVITPTVTNFKQIKADPTFNWKSTKVIAVNIVAVNAEVNITNTLFVKTENGNILFTKLHKMNESYTGNITVPSKTDKVIISFGSIVKTVSINNGSALINFIKN
ncbi:MAG: hypothetical protein ACEQSR_06090 [Candidatus Methylacidiphilales bacterium]